MSKRRFPLKEFPELLKNPPPNIDIMLYDKKKEGHVPHPGDDTVKKKTLSQRLDELTEIVTNGFKRVDNLTNDFNSFKQEINARLDYIVKTNNLKDSK